MDSSHVETLGEEVASAITHGIAAALSVVGLIVLIVTAYGENDIWKIVTFSIFGGSMVLLYLMSTLYHSFPWPRAKKVFRFLDHSAIYILIAGTYTPFTLLNLRGPWGWSLFVMAWSIALIGIVVKAYHIDRHPIVSVVLYVAMGWICVIAIKPTLTAIHPYGLAWLVAGGLAYTLGTVFYVREHLPYNHAIWHLFVMTGSTCHFTAVLYYAYGAPA